MAQERLELELNASVSGSDRVAELTKALAAVGTASEQSAGNVAQAFGKLPAVIGSAGREVEAYGSKFVHAAEGVVALTASHTALTAAISKYSAAGASSISTTDGLVNSYRALRLALSPSLFTAATIGVGILTEATLKLVDARGKLIQQQASLAVSSRVPISSIEAISSASRISGANPSDINAALAALRENASSSKSQSALASIGVPTYARNSSGPELLGEIAKGFSTIEDPVARAQAAVDLFGSELGGKVLPQLNARFAEASKSVQDWGLALSDTDRNNIYVFSRDIENLKQNVLGLVDPFKGAFASISQSVETSTAQMYANLRAFAAQLSDFQKSSSRSAGEVPYISLLLQGGGTGDLDKISKSALSRLQYSADFDVQKGNAVDLRTQARSILSGVDSSRESIESRLSAQRELQAKAAETIRANQDNGPNKGGLNPDQTLAASAQLIGSTREIATLQKQLDGIKAQEKSIADAAQTAVDVVRHQQDGLRSSQEIAFRSAYDPTAGRDIRGELLKSTQYVDKDGEVQHYQLLDATRRNLEAAFATYTQSVNRKASEDQIKSEEENFARRKGYEDQIFHARQNYDADTLKLGIATSDRAEDQRNVTAGYGRDEQLGALSLSGIGLTGAAATRNALAQIAAQKAIAQQYAFTTSANDSAVVDRDKRRQLLDVSYAQQTGSITDDQYRERNEAIENAAGQRGTEINDKYAHDLLDAQQQAVIKTTEIIKSLENEQIDRVKSLAGNLFDAATSRQPNAIPNFVRSQVLNVGRTITENLAGEAFKGLRQYIPHASDPNSFVGKALEGTPFGADPLKKSAGLLDISAGKLSDSADAIINAVTGNSGSGSGSGGGLPIGAAAGSDIGVDPSLFSLPAFNGGSSTIAASSKGASALARFLSGGNNGIIGLPGTEGSDVGGLDPSWTALPGYDTNSTSTGFGANAKTVASIGAAVGGGIAAFSSFKKGGVGNDLKGTADVLGSAAGIAALFGPAGAPVALGLGIAALGTSLLGGILGDSKTKRANQINNELAVNAYNAPVALNVSQDSSGHYADYDSRGNLRTSGLSPYPQVAEPYTWAQTHGLLSGLPPTYYTVPGETITPYGLPVTQQPPTTTNHYYTINAMDSESFASFAQRNQHSIADAVGSHIQNTGTGRLTDAIQFVARN